jgi:hypothetical protein
MTYFDPNWRTKLNCGSRKIYNISRFNVPDVGILLKGSVVIKWGKFFTHIQKPIHHSPFTKFNRGSRGGRRKASSILAKRKTNEVRFFFSH